VYKLSTNLVIMKLYKYGDLDLEVIEYNKM